MLELIIAPLLAVSSASSADATDIMVTFARAFCLEERDRLAVARDVVPPEWEVIEKDERLNVAYGIDAPVPLQDRTAQSWRGSVPGGVAWMEVFRRDYRDPARRDNSRVEFGVSPGTLVDLQEFQRRVPIELVDAEPPYHSARDRPQLLDAQGRPIPTQPADFEWMQRYKGVAEPADPDVQIEATRLYGAKPLQKFWMECRTSPDPAR